MTEHVRLAGRYHKAVNWAICLSLRSWAQEVTASVDTDLVDTETFSLTVRAHGNRTMTTGGTWARNSTFREIPSFWRNLQIGVGIQNSVRCDKRTSSRTASAAAVCCDISNMFLLGSSPCRGDLLSKPIGVFHRELPTRPKLLRDKSSDRQYSFPSWRNVTKSDQEFESSEFRERARSIGLENWDYTARLDRFGTYLSHEFNKRFSKLCHVF
jgi:hypothetical protein